MWEIFKWINMHVIGPQRKKEARKNIWKIKIKSPKFNKNYKLKDSTTLMNNKYKKQKCTRAHYNQIYQNIIITKYLKLPDKKKNCGVERNKDEDDRRSLIKNNVSKKSEINIFKVMGKITLSI